MRAPRRQVCRLVRLRLCLVRDGRGEAAGRGRDSLAEAAAGIPQNGQMESWRWLFEGGLRPNDGEAGADEQQLVWMESDQGSCQIAPHH